jgi:NAD(P)-dependent dehydrogenase (short-subunit alcohol dehydrogenase family)
MTTNVRPTVLIVGASRGLGHAMAAEFLRHDWNVIGTVRDIQPTTAASTRAGKPRSGTSGNAGCV